MKTPLLQYGKWALVVGGLILNVGCMEEFLAADAPTSEQLPVKEQLQLAQADDASPDTKQTPGAKAGEAPKSAQVEVPPKPVAAPALEKTNAPAAADVKVVQSPMPPANIQLSPALSEIVKLIQSGVGED